jgi:hypothetical protein
MRTIASPQPTSGSASSARSIHLVIWQNLVIWFPLYPHEFSSVGITRAALDVARLYRKKTK